MTLELMTWELFGLSEKVKTHHRLSTADMEELIVLLASSHGATYLRDRRDTRLNQAQTSPLFCTAENGKGNDV